MLEATAGKKLVYLFRKKTDTAAAGVVALTTENGRSMSKDSDSTATKDGTINTPGTGEQEITLTAYVPTTGTMLEDMEDDMWNDETYSIWEANLEKPGATTGKYKGKYFEGIITSMEISSPADDLASIDISFAINGSGERGDVTVTDAQAEAAGYNFKDTVAVTSA